MKIFLVFSFSILMLCGCEGAPAPREPETPRREYQSIDSSEYSTKVPSIIGKYNIEDVSFNFGSINFSTALFLSDIGMLNDVPKDTFEKYATALFSQFPVEGDVKEMIIPGLSLSEEDENEKDAYIFISKSKTKDGSDYYVMDTNIPIASNNSRIYDGYVMQINAGFYKDKVPARWTSIMSIMVNNDILLYRGIAYPSKSAPLIFTGTGIGSDTRMNAVLSGQTTIAEAESQLKSVVEQALAKTIAENQQQVDSMKFLEKDMYLSLSAYSYIDSDFDQAKEYFYLAKEVEAVIPNDAMGSRYSELEAIMEYLIEIMECVPS